MAATKLIAMHVNKGKTVAQCLKARTDYAKDEDKTEEGKYITTYACNADIADKEFAESKREYLELTGRQYKGDIIAYQIRQSFKPGEISPEEANQIGYETAMRFTKGEHAFLVCTHTDKEHIHNHVIFNSVNLACDRKFRDSWFCGIGLGRLSDQICLEHGMSVIKPYEKRGKKPKYEKSYRDEIREEIDKVLATKPQDFNRFLQLLLEDEYEIKRGKYLAIRQKDRKNFVRFKSLGTEYSEEKIRAVIAGEDVGERPTSKRKFDLLIDIQEKLRQGKGRGYELWGKKFNNKAITNTLLYLSEKGIRSYEDLKEKADASAIKFRNLTDTIKSAEQKMAEITELKKHIFNYSKTRDVYVGYRKAGYSKKYFEAHREELTLHKAAKDAFKKIDGKLPTIKELNAEYTKAYAVKKQAYSEYKLSKQEMKELQEAKRNIELFLELDAAKGKEKKEKDRNSTVR